MDSTYQNHGLTDSQKSNLSKVPAITIGFWIIKIFATTLGEVGGNAVTLTMGLGYLVGTLIFGALLFNFSFEFNIWEFFSVEEII